MDIADIVNSPGVVPPIHIKRGQGFSFAHRTLDRPVVILTPHYRSTSSSAIKEA